MEIEDAVVTEAAEVIIPDSTGNAVDIGDIVSFQTDNEFIQDSQEDASDCDPLQIQKNSLEEEEVEREDVDSSVDASHDAESESFPGSQGQTSSTEQSEARTNCLICGASCASTQNLKPSAMKPPQENSSLPSKDESGDGKSDFQYGIMFVIHKLLLFPKSTCEQLKSTYGNPSEWGATCCTGCFSRLQGAQEVADKISNYEMRLKCLQEKIKGVVLTSAEKHCEENADTLIVSSLITHDIRNRFIQQIKEGVSGRSSTKLPSNSKLFVRKPGRERQSSPSPSGGKILSQEDDHGSFAQSPTRSTVPSVEQICVDLDLVKAELELPPSDSEQEFEVEDFASLGVIVGGEDEESNLNEDWQPWNPTEEGSEMGAGGSDRNEDFVQGDRDDSDEEFGTKNNKFRNRVKCSQCSKRFPSAVFRDAHHRRKHLGVKLCYVCKNCGEAYDQHRSLEEHNKTCTKKDGSFVQQKKNRTHLKRRASAKVKTEEVKKSKESSSDESYNDPPDPDPDYSDGKVSSAKSRQKGSIPTTIKVKKVVKKREINSSAGDESDSDGGTSGVIKRQKESTTPAKVKVKKVVKKRKKSSGEESEDSGEKVECSKCSKTFPSEYFRDAHFRKEHLGINLCFICDKCGKGYYHSKSLQYHLKSCKGDGTFIYPDARLQEVPGRPHSRVKLVMKKNEEDGQGNCGGAVMEKLVMSGRRDRKWGVQCPKCTQCFENEHYRNAHVRRKHLGIRLCYICDKCGKAYEKNGPLIIHKRNCTGDGTFIYPDPRFQEVEKFKCTKCYRQFTTESTREAHIKRHHLGVIKPYECTRCGWRFNTPGKLTNHEPKCLGVRRINLTPGEKEEGKEVYEEVVCPVQECGKVLRVQKYRRHYEKYHKDGGQVPKTFICHICAHEFSVQKYFRKHLKKHNTDPEFPRNSGGGKAKKGSKTKKVKRDQAEIMMMGWNMNPTGGSTSYNTSTQMEDKGGYGHHHRHEDGSNNSYSQEEEALAVQNNVAVGDSSMNVGQTESDSIRRFLIPSESIMVNYAAPSCDSTNKGHGGSRREQQRGQYGTVDASAVKGMQMNFVL